MIPILLDTDIGSDIDDAVALTYLLRQPRCELLGITTVTGEVQQRCACAEVICRAAGREEIPIHPGASTVLLVGPGQPLVPQYGAIRELPHRLDRPANTAVEFLRQTIRARPGEITLLTIGPFTNVALLLAVDPEIGSLLKGLVSMAGIFYPASRRRHRRTREWNCMSDPIATSIAFAARVPGHTSFGLDVTQRCILPAETARQRFGGDPVLDLLARMAEVWLTHHEVITFHDPLAATTLFDDRICTFKRGNVDVELISPRLSGFTNWVASADNQSGAHEVALSVDSARFFDHYFSVFS
jgi:purine nucleosidase